MLRSIRRLEHPRSSLLFLALALTSAACSGSGGDKCPDGATAPCTANTGSLAITVTGLASGTAANITVTGQNFSRTVTAAETLTLTPGSYLIAAFAVIGASFPGGSYQYLAPANQSATVTKGQSTGVTVGYQPAPPRARLVATGVPAGVRPPWSLAAGLTSDFGDPMPRDTTVTDLPTTGGYYVRAGGILTATGILSPKPRAFGFPFGPGVVVTVAIAWEETTLIDLIPSTNGAGGTPATGLSSSPVGLAFFYRITVPPGATRLRITTSGGAGDVDLYCRAGAPPSFPDNVTAFGESAFNVEQCLINNPQAGIWYAQVQEGAEPFTGVTVAADITRP